MFHILTSIYADSAYLVPRGDIVIFSYARAPASLPLEGWHGKEIGYWCVINWPNKFKRSPFYASCKCDELRRLSVSPSLSVRRCNIVKCDELRRVSVSLALCVCPQVQRLLPVPMFCVCPQVQRLLRVPGLCCPAWCHQSETGSWMPKIGEMRTKCEQEKYDIARAACYFIV